MAKKRVTMIKTAWEQQKEIKNVMLFLQSNGVSPAYAIKIYKTYGNESIKLVKGNPYRLADDIWGIGFKTADKIAQKLGYDPQSFERCRAGIIYSLSELSNEGHCFATKEQLSKEATAILELPEATLLQTIDRLLQEKTIILDFDTAIYLPAFYHSEVGVANRIKEIIATSSIYQLNKLDEIIVKLQKESKISYDEVQLEAIKNRPPMQIYGFNRRARNWKNNINSSDNQSFRPIRRPDSFGGTNRTSGQTDGRNNRNDNQDDSPVTGIPAPGRI